MTLVLAALAVAVNILLMIAFYRRLSARFSPGRVLGEIRGELDRLVADLGRETDRDVALLENRIQGLRSLIDEADRRILLADREAGKRRDERATLNELSRVNANPAPATPVPQTASAGMPATRGEPAIAGEPAAPVPPATAETAGSSDGGYSRASIARARAVNSSRRLEPVIPTVEHVVSLANRGFSPDIIASKLSLSLGEVELILDIHVNNAPGFGAHTKDSSS